MSDTTVIIKTIGRPSLKAAVHSAKREGFKPIVISDGVNCHNFGAKFIKLGKKWGMYGGMAANVGAAIAPTEFITFLDDDDVFIPGAGNILRSKLNEKPEVDIWISGVRFARDVVIRNTETGEERYRGTDLSIWPEKGLSEGNVAMPTYRTTIFKHIPFIDAVPEDIANLTDLLHVRACAGKGYKVDWVGEALYLVRPHINIDSDEIANGRGSA